MSRLIVIVLLLCWSCDTPNTWDCFQSNGERIQQEFQVTNFNAIRVRDRIQLVVKQGPVPKVVIESGSNLINDISAIVENEVLIFRDANACNLVRDYNATIAYVTTPNITTIRNESGQTVKSDGVLNVPLLRLISEDFTENDRVNTDGDFNMELAVGDLEIQSNNLSNFFLSGTANRTLITIFSGDTRVEARDLVIQELNIYHRGTNQLFVNPIQSIRGEIRSGGDVIAVNEPPIVEVIEYYTGRLIFQD